MILSATFHHIRLEHALTLPSFDVELYIPYFNTILWRWIPRSHNIQKSMHCKHVNAFKQITTCLIVFYVLPNHFHYLSCINEPITCISTSYHLTSFLLKNFGGVVLTTIDSLAKLFIIFLASFISYLSFFTLKTKKSFVPLLVILNPVSLARAINSSNVQGFIIL